MRQHYGRYSTYHQLEINAPAEEVWCEIENFENWLNWNPLYVQSAGKFILGETIQFTVAIPGMSHQQGQAKVIVLEQGSLVQYQMRSMGGLSVATRFIEIKAIETSVGEGNRCSMVNGECMGGLLAPLLYKGFGNKIHQGLQGMNEALKQRMEK